MKKVAAFIFIIILITSCSSANRVNNIDNLGSTIDDGNSRIGRSVIRINGTSKPDEIYYVPFYKHNW